MYKSLTVTSEMSINTPAKQVIDSAQLNILRSKTPEGFAAFYSLCFGWPFPKHMTAPVQALCDDRISRLLITISPGASKSQSVSIAYPAWLLGHDPNHTILNISASEGLSQGFVQAAMEIIEWSPWWKIIFPNVKPDKDSGWSSFRGAYVTGRNMGIPDPSYAGAGITSKALTGKHAKLLLLDDVHDADNSSSDYQRERVVDRYYSQLLGRADPSGAKIVAIGRRWAIDDLYGHLLEKGKEDWVCMTLPAARKGTHTLYWDVQVPKNLKCCFNE